MPPSLAGILGGLAKGGAKTKTAYLRRFRQESSPVAWYGEFERPFSSCLGGGSSASPKLSMTPVR